MRTLGFAANEIQKITDHYPKFMWPSIFSFLKPLIHSRKVLYVDIISKMHMQTDPKSLMEPLDDVIKARSLNELRL